MRAVRIDHGVQFGSSPRKVVMREAMVRLAAGVRLTDVCAQLGVSRPALYLWRHTKEWAEVARQKGTLDRLDGLEVPEAYRPTWHP